MKEEDEKTIDEQPHTWNAGAWKVDKVPQEQVGTKKYT